MSVFMRAKIQVNQVVKFDGGETIRGTPVCKAEGYDESGLDENNTYAQFTPAGDISLTIMNPAMLGQIQEGDEFYLDFTRVE